MNVGQLDVGCIPDVFTRAMIILIAQLYQLVQVRAVMKSTMHLF